LYFLCTGFAKFDWQCGARPLKRAIQEHLLDRPATNLLEGQFNPGDRIKVSARVVNW